MSQRSQHRTTSDQVHHLLIVRHGARLLPSLLRSRQPRGPMSDVDTHSSVTNCQHFEPEWIENVHHAIAAKSSALGHMVFTCSTGCAAKTCSVTVARCRTVAGQEQEQLLAHTHLKDNRRRTDCQLERTSGSLHKNHQTCAWQCLVSTCRARVCCLVELSDVAVKSRHASPSPHLFPISSSPRLRGTAFYLPRISRN